MNRVSGPMLDRIDLHIDVPALNARALTRMEGGEPSASIRARVLAARDRQLQRQGYANAHMSVRQVREICVLDEKSANLIRNAIQKLGLSARAYHRVLKLARTIADLEAREAITSAQIAEAIQYRSLDRVPNPV